MDAQIDTQTDAPGDARTGTPARTRTLTVASRFCGPPRSGNGGYTAGLLAARLPTGPRSGVRVRLRLPTPLDVDLSVHLLPDPVEGAVTSARLLHGADLVAEAQTVEADITPVDAVTLADACEAEQQYAGLRAHPFPTCFTCGPDREPGDGLRLAPGPVPGRSTACTWSPDASLDDGEGLVGEEFVWAALDCPGGWTADLQGRPMVLGEITAQIDGRVEVGERHVVMGRLLGEAGRKTHTATTIYDSDGRVVARAEHVWIAVDPAAFG
ncbi:MAG TPA: hypothetical protein VFJ14_03170 [Nocardioidaceae bacterium]|nr:hypothetical protein [Nocardioidaceae bacterium]